jgi:transposase
MQVNNNLKKNAHISEGKLMEILQLFCTDLNATQIAQASDVSRVTVNNYVKFFRVQIAKYCEEQKESIFAAAEQPAATMYQHFSDRHFRSEQLAPGVGVIVTGKSLIADPINNINSSFLNEHLKRGGGVSVDIAEANGFMKQYNAIIDFERKRMYRIKEGLLLKKGRHDADEIDFFWKLLKMRIVKMRGLQVSSLYLHVKETEFRYNNRNRELYQILLPLVIGAKSDLN